MLFKKRLTNLVTLAVLFLAVTSCTTNLEPVVNTVRINSVGYTPDGNKVATILAPECETVNVRNVDNKSVAFEATVAGPFSLPDTNITFWTADFSGLTEPGIYSVEVPGHGRSIDFEIGSGVYNAPYYSSMRAMYLWRCGTEVFGVHDGDTFQHAACHLDDGYLDYTEFGTEHKDGTGGWHDAGDYGKYIVNAGITMGNLFYAWDHFGDKLETITLDIPETAPEMPDFLEELKWETDWFLKMQYPDNSGRISHKLTRLSFSGFIMPEQDTAKRYFTEWGSNATAHFTAVMAMAARYFEPYNAEYAQTCLDAAKNSYGFLIANPEYKRWQQREFSTGGYQARDEGTRLWAAAELWETTGEEKYLKDFEEKAAAFEEKIDLNWDWGNVKNMGMFTYLQSEREGKDEALYNEIKTALIDVADTIAANTQNDVFGRPFDQYYWGVNGTVARLSITLNVANNIEPSEDYVNAAHNIIAHLFGRNYYNRSYVTGIGIDPPMYPHSRRSGADEVEAPWPGYLVGGGHTPTDWVDVEASYSHNEIAINWQAPLVYVLAWLAENE